MASITSNTAYGIIRDAYKDAGFLGDGDDPNSEQLADGLRRLNDLINLWQIDGIKLFLLQEITITLVAGQASYTVVAPSTTPPNKHLRIEQARVQTPQGNVRPIYPISWEEWNRLNRSSSGSITGYHEDKQATTLTLNFWNTPDSTEAANSVIVLVRTQAANPFNLEGDVSFPQEWRIALRWGLADDICTGQPVEIMNRCAQRATMFKEQLEGWDVESGPTTFAPASHAYQGGGFR